MKKKRDKKTVQALSKRTLTNDFLRGALAGAVLATVSTGERPGFDRKLARVALQGGAALALATWAADAVQRGQPVRALLAATGTLASVHALEYLLPDPAAGATESLIQGANP
ncbi:MAG: hypothetical protein LBR88_09875 [Zoogloeaceae bacterium]|jgi:hypothetical protein|nr:hypothetical protein [Zoogloeaceae bacterium]